MAYINDLQPYGAERWIEALRAADQHAGADTRRGRTTRRARRAHRLGRRARRGVDTERWSTPTSASLPTELRRREGAQLAGAHRRLYAGGRSAPPRPLALDAESESTAGRGAGARGEEADRNHGSQDAIFGDRFRVGRGDRSWPVEGGGEPGSEAA